MSYVFKNVRQLFFRKCCKPVLYKMQNQPYSKLLFSIFLYSNIQFLLKRYLVEIITLGILLPLKADLRLF